MNEAPTPIAEENSRYHLIDLNNLKIKKSYNFKEYIFTVGLIEGKIIFIINENENFFQDSKNYDSITKDIPNLKASQDIKSIYNILIALFDSNKYEIKNDEKNQVKIIVKTKDILGNDELHDIILPKIELDNKNKIRIMGEKIKELTKKVEELTKDNKEIKEKLNLLFELYNKNKSQKEDLVKQISKQSNKFNNIQIDSNIIEKISEINFIFEEIKKDLVSINNIKLIYRATKDGDSITEFHSKCDNIKNTLMIIQTTSGHKFGGFTSTGWNSERGKDIYDQKAFCFSINLNKIYNIKKPEYALHIQSLDGRPSFGSNKYVFILQNKFLTSDNNYVEKMTDYKGETEYFEINGKNKNFKVNELEVYQIS